MGAWRKAITRWAGLLASGPAVALACPACAGRADTTGAVGWAVAGMIASPLVVAGVLGIVAHRLQRER